jgi:Co/Zn/Cd efflux system component
MFLEPREITRVDLVMYTALSGIIINLIGMFLFNENEEEPEVIKKDKEAEAMLVPANELLGSQGEKPVKKPK